jgi:transcriptional regulator with XRE-family HTH domain
MARKQKNRSRPDKPPTTMPFTVRMVDPEKLRERLESSPMNQTQLGAAMGVNPSLISKWLRKRDKPIDHAISSVDRFCRLLNCQIDDLLSEYEVPQKSIQP